MAELFSESHRDAAFWRHQRRQPWANGWSQHKGHHKRARLSVDVWWWWWVKEGEGKCGGGGGLGVAEHPGV